MDKRLLIMSFVIITVIMTVAFNFEDFTGQVGRTTVLQESLVAQPKGEGSVIVEPKVIVVGEYIYITIKPGNRCIDNDITIYKVGRKLPIITFKKPAQYGTSATGASKYCKEATIQYKTWSSWAKGDYYVQVRELPMKVTGKIKERTIYYTDDFKIKSPENYPKIVYSSIGDLRNIPQIISGQRYIFPN